jgi:vitamin B12 transporter
MVDSNSVAYTVGARTTNALVGGYQIWLGAHTLQLSVRRDDNSQFGSHDTGSIGYGYQFNPAWRATASAGTAFRAPTFNDLYWPVDFSSFYVGNPDLRPERARNREVGLVYEAAAQRISLSVYDNRVSDLISFGNAPAPAFFVTTVNVGTAVLKGATASYNGRFGNWTLRASYDVLSAKDADSGNYLIRRAKDNGSVEWRYRAGRWDSGAQLVAAGSRWVDAANTQRTGGFGLVNADARYALVRDWSLIARVNNLFDKKYELVQGFNTPGASLFVGVRYAVK